MVQGNALGTSVVSVEAKSGGWTMSENTNIMNGMIAQRTTLESDAALAPLSLQQGASMQGQQTKTDVAFTGGKAKGSHRLETLLPCRLAQRLIRPFLQRADPGPDLRGRTQDAPCQKHRVSAADLKGIVS
jgi:hypothetical protein